ncbi:MAG: CPBP family glutamic-type intramembrane protease [Ignavibacteriales bacterium]|nr:CPBP family glutamic-type intramembrane protease [Ignavibacteriales bacterium]
MTDNQLNNQVSLPNANDGDEEKRGNKPKITPVAAAYFGLILVFILYQFGGSLLTITIFGLNLKDVDVTSLRLLTTAGQILFILLPALVFSKYVYENVSTIIRFKAPKAAEILLFSLGLILLAGLLQNYLYIQNYFIIKIADAFPVVNKAKLFLDQIDKIVEESYAGLLRFHSISEASFIVFVVAVVPAVCEETFFRGFIQKSFEHKYKPFISALITAIFFGIYHFHPYQVLPLILLGLYFGYAAYKSESIFLPISLHFLNNFIAVILYFVFGMNQISTPMSVSFPEVKISVFSFLGLSILFLLVIYYINRTYYKPKLSEDSRLY